MININSALFSDGQKLCKLHACYKSFLINSKTGCSRNKDYKSEDSCIIDLEVGQ